MDKKTNDKPLIDIRIERFVEVFLEEIYGLEELVPCCFFPENHTLKHHLSPGSCGVDGKKCNELRQHPTKNRAKRLKEDQKHAWCTVEMGNRMWAVLRVREEGTKIIMHYDKLIPETLKNVWREAAIQRDCYIKKPYVFSVKLKSVDKKIG
tara:strand:+ start:293 stop:745 length:453 start_codon:yes stop_codon:yes gene_type:complete